MNLCCAAGIAPSIAWTAILTASLAYITILAASLVNRAQLAASMAALFRQYQLDAILPALFWQRHPEHQPNCALERGAAVEVYWYMLGYERM